VGFLLSCTQVGFPQLCPQLFVVVVCLFVLFCSLVGLGFEFMLAKQALYLGSHELFAWLAFTHGPPDLSLPNS
jgi:hypothetical protein